ncbi:AMP-binding protein [Actinomycetaceae bacterium TAE3-ERU4]|nr:AMP-binding protein [Actinomycetaceae bacterium TAE3-ERU4]
MLGVTLLNDLTTQLRSGYAPGVPDNIAIDPRPLTSVLETATKFYPENVAIDFLGAITTYTQLLDRSRRAATVFSKAGVKPGDRIAFILPNCPQHVSAFYGALYLGAIVAQHNPLAPASQLREQLRGHGAKVAIIWEKIFDTVAPIAAELGIKLLTVDLTRAMNPIAHAAINSPFKFAKRQREKLRPAIPVPSSIPKFETLLRDANPWDAPCPAQPQDIAILLHTGGTTGTPKAVELTHRNLIANVAQAAAWVPDLHEGAEVFAATLPFFHAFGMTLSLLAAVRLCATNLIFPTFDADLILAAQRRRPITFFPGVAPMFKRLYAKATEEQVDMTSIRYSLSGAMPLTEDIATNWESLTKGYIIEGYGMTEGSPILLGNPLSPNRRPGSLGLPFPSTEIRITNPENPEEEMPIGENGEILVRGPQIFHGYWNNPEETANTMWKDWLRTGDIGRVEDGSVIMADRKKELIITGGFNVYPTQVEEAVRSMPGIDEVAVVGMPDATSGEKIVAAIVADGSASIDLEAVRAWAEKTLSHYALPKQIALVSELPRSQVGKVLRRTVREQLLSASESASAGLATLSEQASQTLKTISEQARAVTNQVWPSTENKHTEESNSQETTDEHSSELSDKE